MNFELPAQETFQILRSYDYEVVLYDDEGKQVFEPIEARRFYAKPENLFVSVVDADQNSAVRLYLSKSTTIQSVQGLATALRSMATKYNMTFHMRKFNRVLSPKDFATRASVTETEQNTYQKKVVEMNILEGMYGTSRSSYLKLENARLIVRHSARVNENVLGARGRNIDSIYVENGVGERILFPTTQLAPARALTYHVDNGGSWADPVGAQICRMAQDFANLGAASRHIGIYSAELTESACNVREKLRECMREMRRTFEAVCRKTRYVETVERLQEMSTTLNEADEDYSEKISELASLLNTDAVSLSEGVLKTVAKTLESLEEDSLVDRRYKMPNEKGLEFRSIAGRKVNKAAWDLFVKGKLDLMRDPDTSAPPVTNKLAELSWKLSAIAEVCADDSMGNLLSFIADELPSLGKDKANIREAFVRIARMAIHITDKNKVMMTPAVQEFAEWINSFDENSLMEWDRFEQPDDERINKIDDAVEAVLGDFRYEDFMRSPFAEDFHYEKRDTIDPSDEVFTVTKQQVVSALASYIENEVEQRHDVTIADGSEDAEKLFSDVAERMREDGYTVEGADVQEDQQLSREDVLLPKNQGDDLKREVTKATVRDPDTGKDVLPDESYINRIQQLAGVNRPR